MDSTLLIVLVVAVSVFVLSLSRRTRGRSDKSNEDHLTGFPYEVQKKFLSDAELKFFQSLQSVIGNRAVIATKVGLGDVFSVKVDDKSKYRGYRNKIDRKHVDFLLCDTATLQPLVGIELDDSSHEREDRKMRDAFVDGVFAAAKLPLLHIPVKRAYIAAEIDAQIASYLPKSTASVSAPARAIDAPLPAAAAQTNQSPRCPKCGSAMTLRTAKTGANAGGQFWGCSTYPDCRGQRTA